MIITVPATRILTFALWSQAIIYTQNPIDSIRRENYLHRSNISLLHLGFSEDDVLVHDRVELTENKLLGILNGALLDNIEETSTSLTQHLNKKVLKLFLWERMVRVMFKIQMCVNIQN